MKTSTDSREKTADSRASCKPVSQRSQAIIKTIQSMVDSNRSLDEQHDVKFLWHGANLRQVLENKPLDARPVTAELDATLDCNYACGFCTYGPWEKRTNDLVGMRSMGREQMETVLRRLHDGAVKGVIFTGGGEPFLNPHTTNGIGFASRLGLRTGIFSNGSPLTAESIDQLVASDPAFFRISANAVTPSVYTVFHGIRDEQYARVAWENIRTVALTLGRSDSQMSFGLGVVVNRINCRDIVPLVRRALEIIEEGGRIDYCAVRPVANYTGKKQIAPAVLDEVRRARDVGLRLAEGSSLRLYFAMEYFEKVIEAAGQGPVWTPEHCVGHPWMVSVAYNADVYLCSEGKGQPKNRLGNLLEQTLDEIWESPHRSRVLCSGCMRPPVCKANRLTTRIEQLMEHGQLDEDDIAVVEEYVKELNRTGTPGGVEFL